MSEQKPGRPHAKAAKLFARAAGLIAVLSCLIASIDGRAASAFVTTATPPAQQAKASKPIELLEHLTPEEARELASRLPESEAREMLLGQLEKSSPPAEAPTPAVIPGMLGDMQAEMYVLRARLNEMLSALPNLPSIGPFVLKRITKQYEPEHVWALASYQAVIFGAALFGEALFRRLFRPMLRRLPTLDAQSDFGKLGALLVRALVQLLNIAVFGLVVVVAMIVISSLGINIGPLLAGAGVVGIAVGFGAQTLVRDILSGIFFSSTTPSASANTSMSARVRGPSSACRSGR